MTVFDMVKKKHLHFDDMFLLAALLTKADNRAIPLAASTSSDILHSTF